MSRNDLNLDRKDSLTDTLTEQETADPSDRIHHGLLSSQVGAMRQKYGHNKLTPPTKSPWWKDLLSGFQDPTIRILLIAALISLVVTAIERTVFRNNNAGFFDSLGIFIAIGLATTIAFFSERKSGRAFELLNKIRNDIPIKVFRDNQIDSISISDIVVGDLVKIDAGDKIPADGILVASRGIQVDCSMLTGESMPVKREVYREDETIDEIRNRINLDHPSFLARGTTVIEGGGLMVVLWVGDQTQMGKIARELEEQKNSEAETPLVQKLSRLANQISLAGIIGALVIFGVMTVEDLIQTPLLGFLREKKAISILLVVVTLGVGILTEKFLLRRFFVRLGVKTRLFLVRVATLIPIFLGLLTIGISLVGMAASSEQDFYSIALLRETLMAFVVAVTIIVVAVPEGLPMMVTMSLALNMRKMSRQNCLVRRLVASETIGSATVICTDKTGTLTENRMKVGILFLDGREYRPSEFDRLQRSSAWERLSVGIALNTRAMLHFNSEHENQHNEVVGIGNVTESALLNFLYCRGIDYRTIQNDWNLIFELEHNSQRKMSLTAGRMGDEPYQFIKGAPEKILRCCSTIFSNEVEIPLDRQRDELEAFLLDASRSAYRVLAFAEKREPTNDFGNRKTEDEWLEQSDFRLIALVGLSDPIRPEAALSVRQCQNAHIDVKMITGDSPATAKAIANSVGIPTEEQGAVLTSAEFNQIPDNKLLSVVPKIHVLARATPFDKLKLVKALHRRGEVVAMTGDGINDAPALKSADVGISMGKTGTELAKDASDIVLLDDNFKSIVTGVLWGRTLFQNIRRFVQFQLSVNASALLCALVGPLVHVPLPLTVTQLLWINIIMDTFAALALSTEPPRPLTLNEKPIPRSASIITGTMGLTILSSGIYQTIILFLALFGGWFVDHSHCYNPSISVFDPEYVTENRQALTVFFTIFVMFQVWHAFNCRALRSDESGFRLITGNPTFILIITVIAVVQIAMVQIPMIGNFFRTEPLNLRQWISILLLTSTIIPVIKGCRFIAFYFPKSTRAEKA